MNAYARASAAKLQKKTRIKCNQMKKRQEYERKLTQIIPNTISTFQKITNYFLFYCCNIICRNYKRTISILNKHPQLQS